MIGQHRHARTLKRLAPFAALADAPPAASLPPPPPPACPKWGHRELAALGPDGAGVMERTLVDTGAVDPLAEPCAREAGTRRPHFAAADLVSRAGRARGQACALPRQYWFPETPAAARVVHRAGACRLERPRQPGRAIRSCRHRMATTTIPVMLSRLGRKPCPTKGYVVASIRHGDPRSR